MNNGEMNETGMPAPLEQMGEPTRVVKRAPTYLAPAAVKRYALAIANAKRAGKFKRVSKEFCVSCEAAFEAKVRGMAGSVGFPSTGKLTTRHTKQQALEKLEELALNIVHGKVMSHPTIGKTLKA